MCLYSTHSHFSIIPMQAQQLLNTALDSNDLELQLFTLLGVCMYNGFSFGNGYYLDLENFK